MTQERAELMALLPPPGDPHLSAARQQQLKSHLIREIQARAPRRRRWSRRRRPPWPWPPRSPPA
jgi:hypothetical protein